MRLCRVLLVLSFVCCASAMAQETPFTVQLTGAISAQSSHKGDPVGAKVVSPAALKGDLLEGKITDSGVRHGHAELLFTFDTLMHGGQSIAISSTVTSITNSKGQQGVDEEGNPVEAGTASPQQHHHSHFGSFGGMVGGAVGQEIGNAADTAASMLSMKVSAKGSSMTLDTGSTIGLNVKSTGGQDLASLAPNQPAAPASSSASTSGQAPASGGATQAAGGEPNLVTTKQDFVPGEKTVFFDDFHDMPPGEPPPHWKVRGGAANLMMGGGVRELRFPSSVNLTSPTIAIPEDFTLQAKFTTPDYSTASGAVDIDFRDKDDDDSLDTGLSGDSAWVGWGNNSLGSGKVKVPCTAPCELDLWAQGGRVRLYFNGKRLVDVNQVKYKPMTHLYIDGDWDTIGLRSIRIAESAPDPGLVLASTGKYVTHGIYFDTDSDILKPASAGVIKEISAALYKNPDMKLEIDGYTDSTGNAAHNLDLSNRRAEAVMKVLVSQFGIDQSRLTAKGYGDANPIASNDTPEGRADNRRVEFIKEGAHASAPASSGTSGGSADAAPAAGAATSASAGKCSPLAIPTGTRLFPAYNSGSKDYVKLKPPEQVAYLMLLSIRKLEERCNDELNRPCTLPELVKGVEGSKRAFNGPIIGLDVNPACDAHYSYAVAKVMGGWRLTIEPRQAGLGGFLDDEGAPPGTGIYYNPSGAASKHSHRLNGNGWGVGPHAQGGDFERTQS